MRSTARRHRPLLRQPLPKPPTRPPAPLPSPLPPIHPPRSFASPPSAVALPKVLARVAASRSTTSPAPWMFVVRDDSALVDSLGASESSYSLWTFGGDEWQTVDPTSFALDTTDHLISGTATDFNYFAVAVPTNPTGGPMTAAPGDERAPGIPE